MTGKDPPLIAAGHIPGLVQTIWLNSLLPIPHGARKGARNLNVLKILADRPYENLHGLEVNIYQGLRWQQSLSIAILPP